MSKYNFDAPPIEKNLNKIDALLKLLYHKGIPENEYWDTNYDTDKLDDEIREALQNGEYKAFEQ